MKPMFLFEIFVDDKKASFFFDEMHPHQAKEACYQCLKHIGQIEDAIALSQNSQNEKKEEVNPDGLHEQDNLGTAAVD